MPVVESVAVTDFRCFDRFQLDLSPGLTVIAGGNARGKTTLIEAIAVASCGHSFRGSSSEVLIRQGCDASRIHLRSRDDQRQVSVDVELLRHGRQRWLMNGTRQSNLVELRRIHPFVIFSPDDLVLVKGAPGIRRDYLDQLLTVVIPRGAAVVSEFERNLRQRNALLKQVGGQLDETQRLTLDVWDERVGASGDELAARREHVVGRLSLMVERYYQRLAQTSADITLHYRRSWEDASLVAAFKRSRRDDLRRGVSTVGPQRDDLECRIGGLDARHCASQGEQRSLVLAFRLASHDLMLESLGRSPLMLLDDVFSELDVDRAAELTKCLPATQTLMTTAHDVPAALDVSTVVALEDR